MLSNEIVAEIRRQINNESIKKINDVFSYGQVEDWIKAIGMKERTFNRFLNNPDKWIMWHAYVIGEYLQIDPAKIINLIIEQQRFNDSK